MIHSIEIRRRILVFALCLVRKVSASSSSSDKVDFLDLPKLANILIRNEDWFGNELPKTRPSKRDVDFLIRHGDDPNEPDAELFQHQANEICWELSKFGTDIEIHGDPTKTFPIRPQIMWDIPNYRIKEQKNQETRNLELCRLTKPPRVHEFVKEKTLGFVKAKGMSCYTVTVLVPGEFRDKFYVIGTLRYDSKIVYLSVEDVAEFGLEKWVPRIGPGREPNEPEIYNLLQKTEDQEQPNIAEAVKEVCKRVAMNQDKVSLQTEKGGSKISHISWKSASFKRLNGNIRRKIELCVFQKTGEKQEMTLGFVREKEQPHFYYVSRYTINDLNANERAKFLFFGIYKHEQKEVSFRIGSSGQIVKQTNELDALRFVGSYTRNSALLNAITNDKQYPAPTQTSKGPKPTSAAKTARTGKSATSKSDTQQSASENRVSARTSQTGRATQLSARTSLSGLPTHVANKASQKTTSTPVSTKVSDGSTGILGKLKAKVGGKGSSSSTNK